jgi:hypothetical protein
MQDQVLAHPLSVCEVFEVYNPAIRQTHKIHGNADYQVSNKRTKEKEFRSESIQLPYEYSFGCENGTAFAELLSQPIKRCSRST